MDGLLIIDKPDGITSHDVVARARRILKTKRVGHTGTLDPFATGVMVLLIGQATRLAQFLDKDEKEYEAMIQFGSETDTGDKTGRAITEGGSRKELESKVALLDWESVFSKFRGESLQIPPMYSAKKVEGKKLYELAREGKEIERNAVPITISKLELADESGPQISGSAVRVRVACSAGTYIRTLAVDIGRAVGLGAHLTELRRIRAGRFGISDALTLTGLENGPDNTARLIPMSEAAAHLPSVIFNADRTEKTRNGLPSRTAASFGHGEAIRIIGDCGDLIAIGRYNAAEKIVQPKVVFG